MKSAYLAAAATSLLGLAVLVHPATGGLPWQALVLALAALWLELTSVRQPGMGFFSAAPACYLGLALSSPMGPKAALLTAVAAVGLRTVVKKSNVLDATVDLAPLALSLLAYQALLPRFGHPAFLLLDLYIPASWLLPELLAGGLEREERALWARFQHRSRLAWFATRLTAPALTSHPLLLLPALMALQWAAQRALVSYRAEERERLRNQLQRVQSAAEVLKESQSQTRKDLEGAIEESLLKEELARELARTPDYRQRLETTLRLTRSLVPCRSVVIFEQHEEHLQPAAFLSPLAHRLEGSRLLAQEEPIVRKALERQELVDELPAESRLMEGEAVALALPLDARTALYVGLATGEFTRRQRHLLKVLGDVVGPSLETVRDVERLARQAVRSQQLESDVQDLQRLLETTRSLSATLERPALEDALRQAAHKLAPHQTFLLSDGREPPVARAVAESGKPLLLEDTRQSRFEPLGHGERSLLAVPLRAEDRLEGVLLLGRAQAFTRTDLDRIELLALHGALALSNARLHQESLEAYERLSQSEAQLVQSSKLAAVGQLAAGVAHELNTPLGAIVLALDSLDLPGERALVIARDAALRARAIVEKLLYYSREGRVGRQLTDLNQVVKDTLLLIGNQLKLDQVQVTCELGQIPPVDANANEMQQVVTNLILNARDALLEGPSLGREVTVETGREPSGEVYLEVGDLGPGISRENAEHIFDPFFTTKPVGRGTGLGLSVSSQIVAAHGGRISLCNPGEPGARIRVVLPA